jgi:hypothetical protein
VGARRTRPLVLDAGALIAIERGDDRVIGLLQTGSAIHIPAGALAQAWRDPARQSRLARTVASEGSFIHPLDGDTAEAAGRLCAFAGTADVIDASVVQLARQLDAVVVTSDPQDLRQLDPRVRIAAI